jgi:hypothetical protein
VTEDGVTTSPELYVEYRNDPATVMVSPASETVMEMPDPGAGDEGGADVVAGVLAV